ncbi:hypothetical protein MUP01_04005 [Candidatus Bathyarchaeota archaeon]|nr:hypothetical protein [Candidatus Bathyarchaeota archaeon]
MATKSDVFLQEFVLSFGFLGGLFTWIGVDPEEEVMKALLRATIPNNEILVSLIIVLIILATTVTGILGTWQMAGPLGLFIVGMAWISGLIIAVNSLTLWGTILLIAAVILGPIVCDNHKGNGGL